MPFIQTRTTNVMSMREPDIDPDRKDSLAIRKTTFIFCSASMTTTKTCENNNKILHGQLFHGTHEKDGQHCLPQSYRNKGWCRP